MKRTLILIAGLCLLIPAGCGGGAASGGAPSVTVGESREQTITVTVSPTTLALLAGKSGVFTAAVTGSDNKAVTWSVQEGADGGTITDGGKYTAPVKPGVYHVIARSKANADKKAVATVTVKAAEQPITITISPLSLTIETGKSETFTATVTGTDNRTVTWSIQEGAKGGTITDGGRYTAPTVPGVYHVVVTSKANGDKKAIATVTVKAPAVIAVSVKPESITLLVGKSETFAATVTGTDNQAVTWSVREGTQGGSVTDNGRYTAPAWPGTFPVIATSKANPAKKATVTVTVKTI